MERIPIRRLRNQASGVVRRARAGERLVITVDGVPAAELGPLRTSREVLTLDELVAAGAVVAPRVRTPPPLPRLRRSPSGRSSDEVLGGLRER